MFIILVIFQKKTDFNSQIALASNKITMDEWTNKVKSFFIVNPTRFSYEICLRGHPQLQLCLTCASLKRFFPPAILLFYFQALFSFNSFVQKCIAKGFECCGRKSFEYLTSLSRKLVAV